MENSKNKPTTTFNSFKLRKDEDGKTYLDLELQLATDPQIILMRISIPANADYLPAIEENEQEQKQS